MSDTHLVFLESQLPSVFRGKGTARAVQAIVISNVSDVVKDKICEIFPDAISSSDLNAGAKIFARAYFSGVSHPHSESLAQVLGVHASMIRVDGLVFHSLDEHQSKEMLTHLRVLWREPAIEEVRSETFAEWKNKVLNSAQQKKRMDPSFDRVEPIDVGLEFSREEMEAIQSEEKRRGRPFNRAELELIAQSWSEHCKHKIFAAQIKTRDTLNAETKGLFKTHIQAPTKELMNDPATHLLSVFHDNAGVIALKDFDGKPTDYAVAFKMETHNSPSAIAPYGGASTGIVGVHRDILGTGQGAKPIANWDVLCFESSNPAAMRPAFALAPEVVRSGVIKGIEDGGNQSGIPTVQGSVVFDPDFAVKPYVFAGTIGILPKKFVLKKPKPGLKLFCIGGPVGADGLRGAVMSSRDLRPDDFVGSAVQVANAFTQRRLSDALLDARDQGLIDVISDNGAGGLGSSCGEMASLTGGAQIDLTELRTKIDDLHGWERLLSESQERMTIGTSQPENLIKILEKWKVPFDHLGELNNSGSFTVLFEGRELVSMRLEFLVDLCPRMHLLSNWDSSHETALILRHREAREAAQAEWLLDPLSFFSLENIFLKIIDSEHVCSRKSIQRRFDHEVQGRSLRKAFQGVSESSPADGSLVEITEMRSQDQGAGVGLSHERGAGVVLSHDRGAGVVLSHALCPWRTRIEEQVLFSFDEALRQLVIAGAQWESWAGLDNFCWPDPIPTQNLKSGERHLWRLVRANEVLSQLCRTMKMPLISGKDSMKNNSKDFECPATVLISMGASSIDPTLVPVSFIGKANDVVLWLPPLKNSLRDSSFERVMGVVKDAAPILTENSATDCASELEGLLEELKKRYATLSHLISQGFIRAAKDVGEGGLGVALAEMCFGREMGIHLESSEAPRAESFFGEGLGSFVLVVDPHHVSVVITTLSQLRRIGVSMKHPALKWSREGFEISVSKLKNTYEKKGREGFFA